MLRCVALVGLSVYALSGAAAADVLCKGKKGPIAIRAKCKGSETQLTAETLAALGLQGPKGDPGSSGSQGPAGPPGSNGDPGPSGGALRVVDSAGHDVGVVGQAGPGFARVFRHVGNDTFLLPVDAAGFVTTVVDVTSFSYATANCSGTRYLPSSEGSIFPSATEFAHEVLVDAADGHTGYFARGSALQTREYYGASLEASNIDPASSCSSAGQVIGSTFSCGTDLLCVYCCLPNGIDTAAAPVETIDVSQFGLAPPFHFQP